MRTNWIWKKNNFWNFFWDGEGTCATLWNHQLQSVVYYLFICLVCVCFFFHSRLTRLLKFIVLQIFDLKPFYRFGLCVSVLVYGCVNMRHAFTLIDIWCVFIGALINVHSHTHTLSLSLFTANAVLWAIVFVCTIVVSSFSFCLHCLQ